MSKRTAICPKCGSADCAFTERGKRLCNACHFVGRVPLFREGGPKPRHQLDVPKQDCVTMERGALWHRPMRYTGDD